MHFVLKYIIPYLLFFLVLYSQEPADSVYLISNKYPVDFLTNGFNKSINTNIFFNKVNYNFELGNFKTNLFEDYRSTIVTGSFKNIRDENHFNFNTEYKFSNKFYTGLNVVNNIYSDNRNLDINDAVEFETSLFAKYKPYHNVNLVSFGGYSSNKQIGIRNDGEVYGLELSASDLEVEEFTISLVQKFKNEDILPRRNLLRHSLIKIKNNFENRILNEIQFYYNQNRKDFFYDADSVTSSIYDISKNIQKRIESKYFVADNFYYATGISGLTINLNTSLMWRDILKESAYPNFSGITSSFHDLNIEELTINSDLILSYTKNAFATAVKLSYSEKEEKHKTLESESLDQFQFEKRQEIEARKNNKAQLTTLVVNSNYELTKKDLINLNFYQRKLKYDTSSDENNDDRDEILSILKLGYIRKVNPFFTAFVNIEGSYNHLVYLFSERSSNNSERRIIKLAGGGNYKSKIVSSKNSIEVSANYTTYDFNDLNSSQRSFSYRQIAGRDSTNIKLSSKIKFSFLGTIKLSEQGDFNWSEFTSRPRRFVQEIYIEPLIHREIFNFDIGAGLRFFEVKTFSYEGSEKILSSKYSSTGPMLQIKYKYTSNLKFSFTGWYEFINNENNQKREIPNLNLELYWLL